MGISNFTDWLRTEFAARPEAFGRLAQQSLAVVAVSTSRWRGQRLIQTAEISVGGRKVENEAATTKPRWTLLPDDLKSQFDAIALGVQQCIAMYAVNNGDGGKDDDEDGVEPLVLRRGMYAVDAANLPRLKALLLNARRHWNRLADDLCTEEGHAKLLDQVKDKVGVSLFPVVAPLVPNRSTLRTKFGLRFYKMPIRLDAPPDATADEREGAAAAALEALETVVRRPRESLAAACDALAVQLVAADGTARVPVRTDKTTGAVVPGRRTIKTASVLAGRKAADAFAAFGGFVDPELKAAVATLAALLPDEKGAAEAVAAKLREDDALAVAVGAAANKVAALARDEDLMCAAVTSRIAK